MFVCMSMYAPFFLLKSDMMIGIFAKQCGSYVIIVLFEILDNDIRRNLWAFDNFIGSQGCCLSVCIHVPHFLFIRTSSRGHIDRLRCEDTTAKCFMLTVRF